MLQVVDFTDTDEFGNEPPDGGVLVVGVKYTLSIGAMGTVEDGFRLWDWSVYTTGPRHYRPPLVTSYDPTLVPEEELQAKAVLVTAKEAAQQLAHHASLTTQQAVNVEMRTGLDQGQAEQRVRFYPWVQKVHEIAEWAEGVEHYLWFQRWLVGSL
jgi:hypothetical protein